MSVYVCGEKTKKNSQALWIPSVEVAAVLNEELQEISTKIIRNAHVDLLGTIASPKGELCRRKTSEIIHPVGESSVHSWL